MQSKGKLLKKGRLKAVRQPNRYTKNPFLLLFLRGGGGKVSLVGMKKDVMVRLLPATTCKDEKGDR